MSAPINYYKIKRVSVARFLIRMPLEGVDEDNASKWFDLQAEAFFSKNIFSQVSSVGIDELVDYPFAINALKDPKSGILTYYFVFHGDDTAFGKDIDSSIAYVSVLVDANTGEAYAIEAEAVE